jgi:tRNA modification GTPase
MQFASNTDTICAIATPPGAGGIGVVRMSGPAAFGILAQVWRGRPAPSDFEPRKLYLGAVGFTGHRSRVTGHDKVLAVKMPAPHTYTGQNVVEISCHGSRVILSGIVEACVASGARLAGPGEFTRRAFLAGKMDLAQAEAVCDLIHATGERGARLAAEQLDGRLSKEIGAIIAQLADLRGEVEASIDFPEEGIEVSGGTFEGCAAAIASRVERLVQTYDAGRMSRDGVRVAIVGRPNAGKSSIMNRLAGLERSIVHHEPGTTRDVVEESVVIEGVQVRLRDTAGIRQAQEEVEAMGVARTREEVQNADVVLVVLDGTSPLDDRDAREFSGDKRAVVVINKIDLGCVLCEMPFSASAVCRVSAKTGQGMDELAQALVSVALGPDAGGEAPDGATITSARHKEALCDASAGLRHAIAAQDAHESIECVAQHLRGAHERLAEITGEAATEAVLARIFSRFCIGK